MRKLILFLIIVGGVLLATGCNEESGLTPAIPEIPDQALKAEDSTGNNLSVPVLWAEGFDLPLRGTFEDPPVFLGAYTVVDGIALYHQKDPLNQWQAASADMSAAPLAVDWIDWGDNIESRPWPDKSKVRVEVVLFQDLVEPLLGYEMGWVSGLGIDELWGATTNTYDATQATVYSHCARLTIQKLTENPDVAVLDWDPLLGQWVGDVGAPVYNSAVWYPGDSPIEKYSAEINVKGKVIYGMLWDLKKAGDGPGLYRLTFSLDGLNGLFPSNAFFTEATQIMVPVEEEESADKAEPTGGATHVDPLNNLTYLDMTISEAHGSGGGNRPDDAGGGGGGGKGGGGGGPR